jgi:hypothetical protein
VAAPVIVPAFSAPAAEQVSKVLADAVTGSQIPNLIAPKGLGRLTQRTLWTCSLLASMLHRRLEEATVR